MTLIPHADLSNRHADCGRELAEPRGQLAGGSTSQCTLLRVRQVLRQLVADVGNATLVGCHPVALLLVECSRFALRAAVGNGDANASVKPNADEVPPSARMAT